MIRYPDIDETKLSEVMELIDQIDDFIVEKGKEDDDPEILERLEKLRELSGKNDLEIAPFKYYSSYTSLNTAARSVLMPTPVKENLSDEDIRELIQEIAEATFDEEVNDYFLNVLRVETGLHNITDYIYNPDEVGMELNASLEEVIERILADRVSV